jgi:hypothetical protein
VCATLKDLAAGPPLAKKSRRSERVVAVETSGGGVQWNRVLSTYLTVRYLLPVLMEGYRSSDPSPLLAILLPSCSPGFAYSKRRSTFPLYLCHFHDLFYVFD